jgi:hypothetical protein
MSLNKEQQIVLDDIARFLINPGARYFYLFGCAGSGKTYFTATCVLELLQKESIKEAYICAPTHQALNVLQSYFYLRVNKNDEKLEDMPIKFMTVHKLLSYRPVVNYKSGDQVFKPFGESTLLTKNNKKIVVIDECSMMQSDMIKQLDKYADMYPVKILFLGDPAQLPPVGEPESEVFAKAEGDGPYKHTLTQIMRTKSNDIKKVSTTIRGWEIKKYALIDRLVPIHASNKKVRTFKLYHRNNIPTKARWFKIFVTQVGSGCLPIVLTWRNNTCNNYNKIIRKYIHGTANLNRYLVGDYLMFNNYYAASIDDYNFYTSDIVKIVVNTTVGVTPFDWNLLITDAKDLDIEPVNNRSLIGIKKFASLLTKYKTTYDCDVLKVVKVNSTINDDDTDKEYTVKVINLEDLPAYVAYQNFVKDEIIKFYRFYKDKETTKTLWKIYYENLVDPFAEVIFGYSVTIHKSQGSTFKSVFVDYKDVLANQNKEEMKKALYTAATRASENLGFII